jgi:hypothetical protein
MWGCDYRSRTGRWACRWQVLMPPKLVVGIVASLADSVTWSSHPALAGARHTSWRTQSSTLNSAIPRPRHAFTRTPCTLLGHREAQLYEDSFLYGFVKSLAHGVVTQFAVAALSERRNSSNQKAAVRDRRYKNAKLRHYRSRGRAFIHMRKNARALVNTQEMDFEHRNPLARSLNPSIH